MKLPEWKDGPAPPERVPVPRGESFAEMQLRIVGRSTASSPPTRGGSSWP